MWRETQFSPQYMGRTKKKTKTTNLRTRSDLLTAPVIIHWLNLAGVATKALRDASGSPEVTGRKRQKQASSQDPLITSPTWGYFTLYAFLTPLESLWSSLRVKMYLKPISKFPTAYSMGKHTHKTLENACWDFIDLNLNSLGLAEALGIWGLKVNCWLQLQSMGSQRNQTWFSY